jgi:uncharacterized integral membrane protein
MAMGRIALAFLATVLFVSFALSNTHHVELSFVVGRPVEIRLIFLLAISFGSGVIASLFYQLWLDANRRAHQRKARLQLRRAEFGREDAE